MTPIAFTIGALTIRWYGVMAALGFLSATLLLQYNRKKADLTADQAVNIVFIAMVSGVIGSRIFYVVQFAEQFRNNWIDVIRIDKGGLVFYGGLILALISIYWYCRKCKLDIIRVFDAMTPSLAIGHAFGRVGCFLNGCCFGTVTSSWVGISYPPGTEPYLRHLDAPLHPVQLYEAGYNIIMGIVMMFLLCKYRRRGLYSGIYLVGYGIMRFLLEFFRGDNAKMLGLTIAQYIGMGVVALGTIFIVYSFKTPRINDQEEAQ